jgi:2-phosphoglycerate kinase
MQHPSHGRRGGDGATAGPTRESDSRPADPRSDAPKPSTTPIPASAEATGPQGVAPEPDPEGATPAAGARAPAPGGSGRGDRLWVDDGGKRRPFMRGIVVHSLMARGVSFEEANATANRVRERLRRRGVVAKAEILAEIRKALGDAPFQAEHLIPMTADITIEGKGQGQPFSKGVLSQSLLAAAIDPNDAFDVSRAIERELVRRNVRAIDRKELRRLAFETLSRVIGPEAGERYLVWRRFEGLERPVILLLGGAAGTGKTALALEVAHRLGIGRVLSSDSIRQIMRLMLSKELAPALHGSSYDAYKLFAPEVLGNDPVIEGFRAQANLVSVGIRASIDRAVSENASTVIDGVSLVPGLIPLEAYEDIAHVVFLVVATLDPEVYASRFAARAEEQHQRPAHHYLEHLDAILRIQDDFLESAERHGVPIVDNESFDRAVLLIIRHVTETLRKRGGFDAAALL